MGPGVRTNHKVD